MVHFLLLARVYTKEIEIEIEIEMGIRQFASVPSVSLELSSCLRVASQFCSRLYDYPRDPLCDCLLLCVSLRVHLISFVFT